jgi:hypothetical protein
VLEQGPIHIGQGLLGRKTQVRAELSLIDDPAIAAFFEEGLLQQGVHRLDQAIEDAHPIESAKGLGELLRPGGVIGLQKSVLALDEAEVTLLHLPGEPFMAVDVDLTGEGKHGLHADVHETEVGIKEVVVQNALRSLSEGEARATLPAEQLDATAKFLAAQHGHQPLGFRFLLEQIMAKLVLVRFGFEVFVWGVGVLGQGPRMFHETLRERLDEGQEILALDFRP